MIIADSQIHVNEHIKFLQTSRELNLILSLISMQKVIHILSYSLEIDEYV